MTTVMRVPGRPHGETTTVDLKGQLPFPEPSAVLSLRDCVAFRAIDDDQEPILILTDGVTTLALECGLRGVSTDLAEAAERLSAAVHDYAISVRAVR
jgi:hypothetical protein